MKQQAQGAGRRDARTQAHLSTPARAAAGRRGHAPQNTQQRPRKASAKAARKAPRSAGLSSPAQQVDGVCLRKTKRASAGARWQQVLEQTRDPLQAALRQHSAGGEARSPQRATTQPCAPQQGRRLLGRQGDGGQLPGRAQGSKASAHLVAAARAHIASQKMMRQAASEAQDATAVTEQASTPKRPELRTSLNAQQLRAAPERALSWARPRREAARGVQRMLDAVRRPWSTLQAEARKRPLTTGETRTWPQKRGRWGRPAGGAAPAQICATPAHASPLRDGKGFQAHAASTAASQSGEAITAKKDLSGLCVAAQQAGSFSYAHARQQRQIKPAATASQGAGPLSGGGLATEATAAVAQPQQRGVQQFLHLTASEQAADGSTFDRPMRRSPVAQTPSPRKHIWQRAQQIAGRQVPTERASKLPASSYKRKLPAQSLYRRIGDGTQRPQPANIAEDDQTKASRLLYNTMLC